MVAIITNNDIKTGLDNLLEHAARDVRPSDKMIAFYNFVGSLPLRSGAMLSLLTSIDAWKVVGYAGIKKRTDAAIRVLYQYQVRPWRLLWGAGDHLWQNSYNCRSVRSRGKLVQTAMEHLCKEVLKAHIASGENRKPVIASLGSGSAEQLLHGVCSNGLGDYGARVDLVDVDQRALQAAHGNACKLGLDQVVEINEITIGGYFEKTTPASVDIVEMVGLADYFNNDRMNQYFSSINRVLKAGGFFVGANISSREEYAYAHGVACWPHMYYRTEEELLEMLNAAGFSDIWSGACGLYTFWVAKK